VQRIYVEPTRIARVRDIRDRSIWMDRREKREKIEDGLEAGILMQVWGSMVT
jgi:hypothetical protein